MYNALDDENVLVLESDIEKPISTHTGSVSHKISIVWSSTVTRDEQESKDTLSTKVPQIELLDDAEKDMDSLVQGSLEDWDE